MAKVRRTPRQERAHATQGAIVEGAAKVFDRTGFGNATLSMIADESGISQGAMYFHFKSKEQIAIGVVQEQHVRSFPLIEQIAIPQVSVFHSLVVVSKAMAGQILVDPVVRAGIRLALEEASLNETARWFYEDWIDATAKPLSKALQSGEIVSSLDAGGLARALIGFFTGVHISSQATTGRQNLMSVLVGMWYLLADALLPESKREEARRAIDEVFDQARVDVSEGAI